LLTPIIATPIGGGVPESYPRIWALINLILKGRISVVVTTEYDIASIDFTILPDKSAKVADAII
jgi:hypothetical protein